MNQGRDPAYDAMLRKMLSGGKAVYKSWVDITYTRESYISWIGFDAEDYLPNNQGAFLGIRGTADFLPLYEPQWMKILPGKQKPTIYWVTRITYLMCSDQKKARGIRW